MSYTPICPTNWRKRNVSESPPLVEVGWDSLTTTQLAADIIKTNDGAFLTNSLNFLTAHNRLCVGYRIHRGTTEDFTPTGEQAGQGNCIVDENSLAQSAWHYIDLSVEKAHTYYYKMVAIVQL